MVGFAERLNERFKTGTEPRGGFNARQGGKPLFSCCDIVLIEMTKATGSDHLYCFGFPLQNYTCGFMVETLTCRIFLYLSLGSTHRLSENVKSKPFVAVVDEHAQCGRKLP